MSVKYQIFISSTFKDLVDERQAISRSILDLGHIPAGMELFPSADVEQLTYIKKVIDECDYYVLVIGARYGSLDEEGVSYTQREYEYAVNTRKTVLAFVHNNIDDLPIGKSDKDELKRQKLDEFIAEVRTGRLVQPWSGIADLQSKSIIALTKAFSESPQKGWVRADTVPLHSTMSDIVKYREKIDELEEELINQKAAIKPRFDDAESLDAKFILPYEYWYAFNGRGKDGSDTVNISYKTLFQMIAPIAHNPSTLYQFRTSLDSAFEVRLGIKRKSINADETVMQDAIMHLVAKGLIKMWSSKSAGGKYVTGYQLTEMGVKLWQEITYKKKSEQSTVGK